MHVLMISMDFIPTVGGITAHVYELSKALVKAGCRVSVITIHTEQTELDYEMVSGIDIYRFKILPIGFLYGWHYNRIIKQKLPQLCPDIIHIHGMRPLEFYNIPDVPLVYTNHTSGYLKRIKKGGYRISLLKKLFQKPDLFLAPSEELLEIPFEIHAKKKFISNGVLADNFIRDEALRQKIRTQLHIGDQDIVAIVTRRMVKKNGVSYLAKATQYIKNKALKIIFIGDGEEFHEVKENLEKYFEGRYFLLGSLDNDAVREYYNAADFSILPSLMEATSISGLEAMASSLPLVGTRVGGIPVLIQNGVNGFLCEPENPKDLANTIEQLLSSDFKQMGMRSREIVESSFDWNIIAMQTLDEYKKLLK